MAEPGPKPTASQTDISDPDTDAKVAQTDLPTEWARLHPLSPVVRAGPPLVAVAVSFGGNGLARNGPPWFDFIAVAVVAVGSLIYWLVTRWRIHNGELQLDTGLLRRQQIRVPLTRMQGVDIVRPLLARMVGLSEVRVILAGHGAGKARLTYLPEARAEQVRAQLLAVAHGLDDSTPEPGEVMLVEVAGSRIVAAQFLTARFVIGVLLLIAIVAVAIVAHSPGAALSALLPVFVVFIGATFGKVSAEWEFRLAESPDGLRIRSGLLQTRAETVPYGRIQAIRWVEPLLWRPFGWVRMEVDVARRRSSNRGDRGSEVTLRALFPVGPREDAQHLLARLFPGAVAELDRAAGVPSRAVWRVPLGRRFLRTRYDERYISCCTGRLRPDVVIVPLDKVQSLRWSQGPWSRRLRLASIDVDTAGSRFTGKTRFRDVGESEQWMQQLPDACRGARQIAARSR